MPVVGLMSGKRLVISDRQYKILMDKRNNYAYPSLIDLIDENKIAIGKLNPNAIEFVLSDESLLIRQRGRPGSTK